MVSRDGWRRSTCRLAAGWSWTRRSFSRQEICARTRLDWKAATRRPIRTATRELRGEDVMDWQTVVFLGAYHGLNPGMGWLFAVALGMQQGSARGVWRALPPIAIGHALAVGTVLMAASVAGIVIPLDVLKVVIAAVLIAFGCDRMWRHRH